MNNAEIIKILDEIAVFLELKNESIFKIRAYEKAARSLEFLSEEISGLVKEDRLKGIPGVGEAITKKLTELVTTGHLEYYDKLKAELPQAALEFLEIPGIGPRTAMLLAQDVGLKNVDELEQAIIDGRVAKLPRMGEKTAQNILQQIKSYRKKKSETRIPLFTALSIAGGIIESMKSIPGLKQLTPAGSLRRFKDTIGDIDLLGTADNPSEVIEAFSRLPVFQEITEKGSTKASAISREGIQVDLRMLEDNEFGSALQHFTGSKQHNVNLRTRAEKIGLSLSEYGITDTKTGVKENFTDEESFYRRQGLKYIPPEIREGTREIELAEKGILPELVQLNDIKGDLHIHSDWSDGADTIEELVIAAIDRGYRYIAISDHSGGLGVAHGLDEKRIKEQIEQIKMLRERFPDFYVFTGMEVDIRANGTLDMPDDILKVLDIVTASIHSAMNQSEDVMTARIIKAIENPHVDVIGHLTARLMGEREPVAVNVEKVLQTAKEHGVAMEINSQPNRLDLKDSHIFIARELGVKLLINTDAHHIENLDLMMLGAATARRGWCTASDILNTLPLPEFIRAIKRG